MTVNRCHLEAWVTSRWYGRPGVLWLFWPLSVLFALVARLRRLRFVLKPPVGLGVPVAVVGGITVGGTGKTPVIIALVEALERKGLTVAVVSRGFGGSGGYAPRVIDQQATAAEVGDEPLMIARRTNCPVVVGRDRCAAVGRALSVAIPDLVLSDDGLQHYRMPRDFEIAVIDAQRSLGNGYHLPMGPLREGAWRLDSVDWILERNGLGPERSFHYNLRGFQPMGSAALLTSDEAVARWRDSRVAAVTALGQPDQFFAFLARLPIAFEPHAFPDHYALTPEDLAAIDADIIVMTEKDVVKLQNQDDERVWVTVIDAEIPASLVDVLVDRFGKQRNSSCTT